MAKKLKWEKDSEERLSVYIPYCQTRFVIYDATSDNPWIASSYKTGEGMSYYSYGNGAFRPRRKKFKSVDQIKEEVQKAWEQYIKREIKYLQSL